MNDEQGLHQIDTEESTQNARDQIDYYYLYTVFNVMFYIGIGLFLISVILFWWTT